VVDKVAPVKRVFKDQRHVNSLVQLQEHTSRQCNITFLFNGCTELITGVVLSVTSWALLTVNNFVINQFVRCVIQIIIYTFIIFYSGDNILPEMTLHSVTRLFTQS
jgi:hypothetical protein